MPSSAVPVSSVIHLSPADTGNARVRVPVVTGVPNHETWKTNPGCPNLTGFTNREVKPVDRRRVRRGRKFDIDINAVGDITLPSVSCQVPPYRKLEIRPLDSFTLPDDELARPPIDIA
jgi:hypothetical protein